MASPLRNLCFIFSLICIGGFILPSSGCSGQEENTIVERLPPEEREVAIQGMPAGEDEE